MIFGVPREVGQNEYRVGLVPAAVDALVRAGHQVFIESSAGKSAGFKDTDYEKVGGKIVYNPMEAYRRADVIVKVVCPEEAEYLHFRHEQAIFGYLGLNIAPTLLIDTFRKNEITAIGAETIQKEDGTLPVLLPTSEIAGGLAPLIAGQLMQSPAGGRGILLNGIPGTPPADVVIIGAGVLGTHAARAFSNLGAQVTVLDRNMTALQKIDTIFGGRIGTMISNPYNLLKAVCFADVVVSAVAVPGERAPVIITKAMIEMMNSRSIIMDYAIDNGGSAETSRPTTLLNPTFVKEGVIHYCVPNTPALVARTASYAFSNGVLPYLLEIGKLGLEEAIKSDPTLKAGVNMYKGKLSHKRLAKALSQKLEVKL
ncbi:MAG: alanine dehydrogenase [Calditrichia bacterium]